MLLGHMAFLAAVPLVTTGYDDLGCYATWPNWYPVLKINLRCYGDHQDALFVFWCVTLVR